MSRFLFHTWNHTPTGQATLEDPIRIISYQLRACGHWTLWDRENDARVRNGESVQFCHGPDEWNVVVEGFTAPVVELIARARRETGARFLCVATEEPTPAGFNHGTQREMVLRQEIFPEAMRYFDGILHLVPGERITSWYAQHAPAAYVELGYAPELVRPQRVREPSWEFGFFGSITDRRYNLLKKLFSRMGKPKNAIKIQSDFSHERDALVQDCKVILQIRREELMGLVSSSRCNTSLCLGRPVVAEPHDLALSKPWDQVVKFTRSEAEFFDVAILTAKRWRDAHGFQMERFKRLLIPEICIGAPLRSLQLNERRLAA